MLDNLIALGDRGPLRGRILSWFGIVGGAITIFGSVETFIKMADWLRYGLQQWADWTVSLWVVVFRYFNVSFPKEMAGSATISLFLLSLAIGAGIADKNNVPFLKLAWRSRFFVLLFCVFMSFWVVVVMVLWLFLLAIAFPWLVGPPPYSGALSSLVSSIIYSLPIWLSLYPAGIVAAVGERRHRLWNFSLAIYAGSIVWSLYFLLSGEFDALSEDRSRSYGDLGAWGYLFPLSVSSIGLIFLIAPVRELIERLHRIIAVLIVLLMVAYISRLGIDLNPPRSVL